MQMVQARDSRGHYTGEFIPDADLAAKWAEEARKAKAAAEAARTLRIPARLIGLTKGPSGSGLSMSYVSGPALFSAALGICFGAKSTAEEQAGVLLKIFEATGVKLELLKRFRRAANKKFA